MDIFDFIKREIEGDFAPDMEMLTLTIPRDDVMELVVVTAIESAAVEGVLRDYRTKLSEESIAGLENAVLFGKSMIHVLSILGKFTNKELEGKLDELMKVNKMRMKTSSEEPKLHFNKSGDDLDTLIMKTFGDKGT